ncbi:hypothetical protein D9M69_250540 [compost metagenome]
MQYPTAAGVFLQALDRRFLEYLDVFRQRLTEPSHQRGRLHQVATRCEDGAAVVAGAQHAGQLIALHHAVGLAEVGHQLLEMLEIGESALPHSALILASMGPLAVDAVAADKCLQLVDGGTVEPQ